MYVKISLAHLAISIGGRSFSVCFCKLAIGIANHVCCKLAMDKLEIIVAMTKKVELVGKVDSSGIVFENDNQ